METTLRMFYARALALVFFALIVFLVVFAGVAFAQDATTAPTPTQDVIGLIFSSASAGAASVLALLLAAILQHAPAWLRAIIDHLTTSEALKWEALTDSALDRAEAFARTKFDAMKDRNGFLNAMVMFLHAYNREIVQYADKNGNGIIDLLEARLPPTGKTPPAAAMSLAAARGRKGEAVQ